MTKLRECPMCGQEGTAVFKESDRTSRVKVVCSVKRKGCGTSSGYAEDNDAATALWNRRPEKPTVAYYVPGEAGFYASTKFMGRAEVPEKHREVAVRLVRGDE